MSTNSSKLQRQRLAQYQAHQDVRAFQIARRKKDQWLSALIAVGAITVSSLGYFAYFQWGPGQTNTQEVESMVGEIVDTIENGTTEGE